MIKEIEKGDVVQIYKHVRYVELKGGRKITHDEMERGGVIGFERPIQKSYYEKLEDCKGIFHVFGLDYEELELGIGSYSIAIIQMEDGTIRNVPSEMISAIQYS